MAFLTFVSVSVTVLTATLARAGATEFDQGSVNVPTGVSQFDYIGCLGSDTFSADEDGTTFTQVEEWEFMNINQCISNCYHAAYAAVNNQTCYCSSSPAALDEMEHLDHTECNILCPGNIEQICGGTLASDPSDTVLLSVYRNTHFAPSSDSDEEPESHQHFDLVRPRGVPVPNPPPPNKPAQSIFPTPISTTYTDICTPTLCPSAYPSEYATTITALMTRTSPESVPTVPMTRKNIAYTSINEEGKWMAMATAVILPDEKAIERIEEEVRSKRREWEERNGEQAGAQEGPQEQVLGGDHEADDEEESVAENEAPPAALAEGKNKHENKGPEDSENNWQDWEAVTEAGEETPNVESPIERRDDLDAHAVYQANDHKQPFAGIGGLGNVQVMPAQGHWEKE